MQHATESGVVPTAPRVRSLVLCGASSIDLAIAGMDCPSCANRIRNALLAHPGVVDVAADVPAALLRVWYEAAKVSVREISAVVAVVGEGTQHQYLAVPVTLKI